MSNVVQFASYLLRCTSVHSHKSHVHTLTEHVLTYTCSPSSVHHLARASSSFCVFILHRLPHHHCRCAEELLASYQSRPDDRRPAQTALVYTANDLAMINVLTSGASRSSPVDRQTDMVGRSVSSLDDSFPRVRVMCSREAGACTGAKHFFSVAPLSFATNLPHGQANAR